MPDKKKKTDREKLNKLIKKRQKLKDKRKNIKGPLKKLRKKINVKKTKRVQKKINKNPKAIEDRKTHDAPRKPKSYRTKKTQDLLDRTDKVLKKEPMSKTYKEYHKEKFKFLKK
jgi:hypothetical protein